MKNKAADPVIEEIREIRHEISTRVDHDPRRLVSYYIEKQKRRQQPAAGEKSSSPEHGSRIVRRS